MFPYAVGSHPSAADAGTHRQGSGAPTIPTGFGAGGGAGSDTLHRHRVRVGRARAALVVLVPPCLRAQRRASAASDEQRQRPGLRRRDIPRPRASGRSRSRPRSSRRRQRCAERPSIGSATTSGSTMASVPFGPAPTSTRIHESTSQIWSSATSAPCEHKGCWHFHSDRGGDSRRWTEWRSSARGSPPASACRFVCDDAESDDREPPPPSRRLNGSCGRLLAEAEGLEEVGFDFGGELGGGVHGGGGGDVVDGAVVATVGSVAGGNGGGGYGGRGRRGVVVARAGGEGAADEDCQCDQHVARSCHRRIVVVVAPPRQWASDNGRRNRRRRRQGSACLDALRQRAAAINEPPATSSSMAMIAVLSFRLEPVSREEPGSSLVPLSSAPAVQPQRPSCVGASVVVGAKVRVRRRGLRQGNDHDERAGTLPGSRRPTVPAGYGWQHDLQTSLRRSPGSRPAPGSGWGQAVPLVGLRNCGFPCGPGPGYRDLFRRETQRTQDGAARSAGGAPNLTSSMHIPTRACA